MIRTNKIVSIALLAGSFLSGSMHAITMIIPHSGDSGKKQDHETLDSVVYPWWFVSQQDGQTNCLSKAMCQIFFCGCCMSREETYELKKSLIEPEIMTILRGGMLTAKEIIAYQKENIPVSINAYGNGLAVACVAAKLLEPESKILMGIVGSAIVSATFMLITNRLGKAQCFRQDVEHTEWNYEKKIKEYREQIQKLILKEGNRFLPRIKCLTIFDQNKEIPKDLQPSELVIKKIEKKTTLLKQRPSC